MTFEAFCHLVRAAAAVTGEREFVIVGSQSIHGAWRSPPPSLLMSEELDLWPRHRPDLADLLDGTLGELSPFHETFGYYVQGVGPETSILPPGWEQRLRVVEHPSMHDARAMCLEPVDLLVAKAVAGREKDRRFLLEVFTHELISPSDVLAAVDRLEVSEPIRMGARSTVSATFRRNVP